MLEQWTIAQDTNIGNRETNQDSMTIIARDQQVIVVVADGMGGHEGGELASGLFCEAFELLATQAIAKIKAVPAASDKSVLLAEWVTRAAEAMQKGLLEDHNGVDGHTTCVAAWLSADSVTIAHVGDSRAYGLSGESVLWRTRDHSVAQMMVDDGSMTEEEAAQSPDQSSLYRSIGAKKISKIQVREYQPLSSGEMVLLCSDGLWTFSTNEELQNLCAEPDLQDSIYEQVRKAFQRAAGESDNITVVAVRRESEPKCEESNAERVVTNKPGLWSRLFSKLK